MKQAKKEWTVLMLVRADSVERIENAIAVVRHLQKTTEAAIYVREADDHCNGIIQALADKEVHYEFVEDEEGNLTLVITDAQTFWSLGKYLVIEVS